MSWPQSLYAWVGRTFKLSDNAAWAEIRGASATGRYLTANTAMGVSTWWACVRLLAETIAGLPLGIYENLGNGNTQKAEKHQLWQILHSRPNFRQTKVAYISTMMFNLCGWGNHFSVIDRGPGGVTSLYPLYPERMGATIDEDAGNPVASMKFLYSMPKGAPIPYEESQILHVPLFGDGPLGLSPVAYARDSLGLTAATEDFGSRFFGNGSHMGGFIQTDKVLTPEQRELYRKSFEGLHQGLDNAHKLAILEGGFKYQARSLPNDEAQFLETRRFQVSEICKWHLVPVSAITESENSSYLSNEANVLFFVKFTLLPYVTRIEQAMERALLSPAEQRRYSIRFNMDGLLRGDTAARVLYFSTMIQNGVITRNEARSKDGWNQSDQPGMDDHTAQVNMAPVGDLGKVATAEALPIKQ